MNGFNSFKMKRLAEKKSRKVEVKKSESILVRHSNWLLHFFPHSFKLKKSSSWKMLFKKKYCCLPNN